MECVLFWIRAVSSGFERDNHNKYKENKHKIEIGKYKMHRISRIVFPFAFTKQIKRYSYSCSLPTIVHSRSFARLSLISNKTDESLSKPIPNNLDVSLEQHKDPRAAYFDDGLTTAAIAKNITVENILKSKNRGVVGIPETSTVYNALEEMKAENIGFVVVTGSDGKMKGIFSERDYMNKIAIKGRKSRGTLLRDVMTKNVTCVNLNTTVGECMALMTDRRFRHIPVVDNFDSSKLLGIVSIGDVLKVLSEEQKDSIEKTFHYIKQSQ